MSTCLSKVTKRQAIATILRGAVGSVLLIALGKNAIAYTSTENPSPADDPNPPPPPTPDKIFYLGADVHCKFYTLDGQEYDINFDPALSGRGCPAAL